MARPSGVREALMWRVGIGHVVMYAAIVAALVAGFVSQSGLIRREAEHRRDAQAANVRARYDDCREGNALRSGIVLIARRQQLPPAVLRQLFPNVPEALLRRARETFELQLRVFAARDCRAYAREAVPRE